MKKYEALEHPAELRIRVFGKTKEELFKNAAYALANILSSKPITKTTKTNDQKLKTKMQVQAADLNLLLVDFLNEILARSQINKRVYLVSDVKINTSGSTLYASYIGYSIDHFDEDIKAVTHQDVDIKLKTKRWQTNLVFDI